MADDEHKLDEDDDCFLARSHSREMDEPKIRPVIKEATSSNEVGTRKSEMRAVTSKMMAHICGAEVKPPTDSADINQYL